MQISPDGFISLSWSDLSCLWTCPRKFYFSKLLHLSKKTTFEDTPMYALEFGKAMHKIRELRGRGTPFSEIEDLIRPTFEDEPSGLRTSGNLFRYAQKLEDLAPKLSTLQTEWGWKFPLVEGVELRGILDEVAKDEQGEVYLIELKTTSRRGGLNFKAASTNQQFGIYCLAATSLLHTPPIGYYLIEISLLKTAGTAKVPWESVINWDKFPPMPLKPLLAHLEAIALSLRRRIKWMGMGGRWGMKNFLPHSTGCTNYNHLCPYAPICEMEPTQFHLEEWDDMYEVKEHHRDAKFNALPSPSTFLA